MYMSGVEQLKSMAYVIQSVPGARPRHQRCEPHQLSTEKMKPNLIETKNKISKARFTPGRNVTCQSAQTDKSVSSAYR